MDTKLTYLGGATFIIEVGPFRFLTDPGFDPKGTEKSEGPGHDLKKDMGPPMPISEVGRIDGVSSVTRSITTTSITRPRPCCPTGVAC